VEYGCVITLAICSTLIGSVLGIRLRFVVLPPIIVLGAACLAVISSAQGAALSQTIVPVVIFVTLLQLGYLCTALYKHAMMPTYAGERRPSLEPQDFRRTPRLR
jgi:hypothetical protein